MKRILFIMMVCLPMVVVAQEKVAVYVTSESNSIDDATKGIVGSELVNAIVQTKKYMAVERTTDFLKQISKEQDYQHSGTVDDEQISALGKQFGVDYVCVANILPYQDMFYIQARLIDVENATVMAIAREASYMIDIEDVVGVSEQVANDLINPGKPRTYNPTKLVKKNRNVKSSDSDDSSTETQTDEKKSDKHKKSLKEQVEEFNEGMKKFGEAFKFNVNINSK